MGSTLDHLAPWPLVGREEELGFIADRIEAGAPGILLTGSAGTGKSRLAREAVKDAADAGRPSTIIACTMATAAVPYAALSPLTVGLDPDADRLHAILETLRDRSERTIVCIDDIDRLDRMSAATIHQAVTEELVTVVATVRTGSADNPDVVSLWKDLGLVRMEIQPLARGEVTDMLASGLGAPVDGLAVKHIWATSHGVPLYVRELATEGVRHSQLIQERGVWVLVGALPSPASLGDLVQVRMADLPDGVIPAAELMGVAEILPSGTISRLVASDSLDHLERAGIVEHTDDRYRLTHPLFGEVIRSRMTTGRRNAVMDTLAAAVEADGLDDPEDLIRVAAWRLTSGSGGTPEVMNDAAHAAYRAGDFELARRLADAADTGGVVEGSLLLGQILHESGDHAAAEAINVELDLAGADRDLVHRAVVQRAVNLFFGLGRGQDALDVLDAGPDALPFNRAWFLINMSRLDEALAVIPAGHPDHRSVLVTSAWADALAGRPDRAAGVVDRLTEIGEQPSVAPSRFRDFPNIPQALGLLESGHVTEALAVAEPGLEMSLDNHPKFIRAWWLFLLGRIHLDAGRLQTAAGYLRQGEVLQAQLEQPGLMRWYLGASAYAEAMRGRSDELGRLLTQARDITDRAEQAFGFTVVAAERWSEWIGGEHPGAVAGLIAAGDRWSQLGAWTAARRLWFEAVRLGGAAEVDGRLDACSTELDRARQAIAVGTVDGRPSGIAEAAEFLQGRGLDMWAAEAWTWASTLYLRAGEDRQATAAVRSADAARARCEHLDTPGLIAERGTVPLTPREREVVTMAAGGTPSSEIAEALFISVRTVNNLIQRSYAKLGVSSRSAAAIALGIAVDE